MSVTIARCAEKFPEPEFSVLQRAVFASVQRESPALADVLAYEGRTSSEPGLLFQPAMVRFGAYLQEDLIGWTCGWLERGGAFYMANSGVVPDHQGRGIYSALLEKVMEYARGQGANVVRSQHSVLNNKVIACKLKRGFHIAGLSVSAQMGSLVELVHHLSEPRLELFCSRTVPFVVPR